MCHDAFRRVAHLSAHQKLNAYLMDSSAQLIQEKSGRRLEGRGH